MKRFGFSVFLLVLITILFLGFGFLWGTPRVREVFPASGADTVAAGVPLRLTFSRVMDAESVEERLKTEPVIDGEFSWDGKTVIFTPSQIWPSGQTVKVHLKSGARSSGWLRLPLRNDQTWSFSIADPLLAYLYPSDGVADLHVLNLQSGEIEKITDSPGAVLDYSVDPTGSRIFYNANHGDGGSTIYQLNRLTGDITTVIQCPQSLCRYPEVSPKGDLLAYERTVLSGFDQPDYPQVWLLPIDEAMLSGQSIGEPFLAGDPTHQTQQPLWSSNGVLAYYDFNESAFVLQNPYTGEVNNFPSQTGIPGDWSPDGSAYVIPEIFSTEIPDLETVPSSRLLRYNYLDSNIEDLTKLDNLEDASPSFSPDGKALVFARKFLDITRWSPGRQLWLMHTDGSEARPITDDPHYNHYDITWSPTGDQLAYVRFNKSTLTELPEIWLTKPDGSEAMLLITGGYSPQWVP